jgi:hypothetical protein
LPPLGARSFKVRPHSAGLQRLVAFEPGDDVAPDLLALEVPEQEVPALGVGHASAVLRGEPVHEGLDGRGRDDLVALAHEDEDRRSRAGARATPGP